MTEINRMMEPTRRNVHLSGEFNAAYEALKPEYVQFSGWAERALWAALIEEHGQEAVLEAIAEAQDAPEAELKDESRRSQYELPV